MAGRKRKFWGAVPPTERSEGQKWGGFLDYGNISTMRAIKGFRITVGVSEVRACYRRRLKRSPILQKRFAFAEAEPTRLTHEFGRMWVVRFITWGGGMNQIHQKLWAPEGHKSKTTWSMKCRGWKALGKKSIEERYIRTLCCAFGHRTGWLATAQTYPGRWRMSINSNTNLVAEEEGVECK